MSFTWTQSALKEFEKDQTCPFRWNELWVNKSYKITPSEAQNYGNYFEYLCIGANAKGVAIPSLPLTKANEKTAVQKRIEIQAEVFKRLFNKESEDFLGYEIKGRQRVLNGTINGLQVQGTLDIEAVDVKSNETVIIDLKLTEDSSNTRTEYGWGNQIQDMDLIQQVLYRDLYYQETGILPKMVLLIFDHGVKLGVRVLNLEISDYRVGVMQDRFITAENIKKMYDERGWVKTPSVEECKRCPLNCDKRAKEKLISIENHKY